MRTRSYGHYEVVAVRVSAGGRVMKRGAVHPASDFGRDLEPLKSAGLIRRKWRRDAQAAG